MHNCTKIVYLCTYLLWSHPAALLTFTPPESAPSGQFWGIYALIGGVRVNGHLSLCSASAGKYVVPAMRLVFRQPSFTVAGPPIRNALSTPVRNSITAPSSTIT